MHYTICDGVMPRLGRPWQFAELDHIYPVLSHGLLFVICTETRQRHFFRSFIFSPVSASHNTSSDRQSWIDM
jgi:hypothetical protein